MIGNTDPKYLRIAAWVIGIATALLVCGYLTADQWLALAKGLI
jgi:hypothetical protein